MSIYQLKALFNLSFAVQVINLVKNNIKSLNKQLSWQIKNINKGLKFIKLDINTL